MQHVVQPSETRTRDCLRSLVSKQLMPLVLLVFFAWLIGGKVMALDFAAIGAALQAITPTQWAASVAAAMLSFWAIGRIDVVVHRLMGTGICTTMAQLSGITSVATAQLAGFGLLTGTLARWRVLPDLSLWKATQISVSVSAAFMTGLAVVTAVMVVCVDTGLAWSRLIGAAALIFGACCIALAIWRPHGALRLRLPPLKAQASLLAFVLLDTGAAALALYVLIPAPLMPPAGVFYAVFLMALGAGLLGATPGGVGPFEMLFLLCLPGLPEPQLLAAIVGYRLVYFALPAVLAIGLLLLGPVIARANGPAQSANPDHNPA